ncbi:MAG TPA: GPP34 family phosphoprotein [Candidatus Bathyarchaeia archaeon]|nr:GPP34 family phosphoprotein [Candidatus Bathyarchaeia archaeon]
MKGLCVVDLLQILRLNKRGQLKKDGNYQLGLFAAAIIDLINLDRLTFKLRDEKDLCVRTIENELTGFDLLDEIYLIIRDCPKEYTIAEWLNRFIDTYRVFENNQFDSLIRREILIEEPKRFQIARYLICFSILLVLPMFILAIVYYANIIVPKHYRLKNPLLQNQLLNDLYENLKSIDLPESAMAGLIIILKTLGLNNVLIKEEYRDYVTKKYYQLQDHDFTNPNIKLLVNYLIS